MRVQISAKYFLNERYKNIVDVQILSLTIKPIKAHLIKLTNYVLFKLFTIFD